MKKHFSARNRRKGKTSGISLNKVGVLATSLFTAASAVCLYSPVTTKANAEGGSSVDVVFTINPRISMAVDASGVNFAVATSREGTFVSGNITAIVDTSSTGGYDLVFSAENNDTSATAIGSATPIRSDFSGSVTSDNMPKDKWGYSLNNRYFSKIPTAGSPELIRNVDHHPSSSEQVNNVYIGAKLSNALDSGTYRKALVFTATAHDDAPLDPSETMQGFDPASLTTVGASATITDTRDGSTYTVKKLADGKVWMTQNLRISGKTLTSADSDLPNGVTYTLPASGDYNAFENGYESSAVYIDSTYGGYYNAYTATAGAVVYNMPASEVTQSICPKGWRLPSTSDFAALSQHYPTAAAAMGEPGFMLSGVIHSGRMNLVGERGSIMTSTVPYDNSSYIKVYSIDISDNTTSYRSDVSKDAGRPVRCIAGDRSTGNMQSFNASTLAVGESTYLKDTRDGSTYTVKKLADGKVWMTQNLRISGKTLTSADSDLPNGVTYALPSSNLSDFHGNDNDNAVYVDPTYGGYYSFYATTAGWAVGDSISGDTPQSICPKGWRLPTRAEYDVLGQRYSDASTLIREAGFTYSGVVSYRNIFNPGVPAIYNMDVKGSFRSSTLSDGAWYVKAAFIDKEDGTYITGDGGRDVGTQIRCVVR